MIEKFLLILILGTFVFFPPGRQDLKNYSRNLPFIGPELTDRVRFQLVTLIKNLNCSEVNILSHNGRPWGFFYPGGKGDDFERLLRLRMEKTPFSAEGSFQKLVGAKKWNIISVSPVIRDSLINLASMKFRRSFFSFLNRPESLGLKKIGAIGDGIEVFAQRDFLEGRCDFRITKRSIFPP